MFISQISTFLDSNWHLWWSLHKKLSMLLFDDSPRRTPVYCLFPPFLSFLECLAHTSQHPRFQPGGPKVRKQKACKTGINTIFLMSSIFTPQHHLSITDIDAHVFLHSPANRHTWLVHFICRLIKHISGEMLLCDFPKYIILCSVNIQGHLDVRFTNFLIFVVKSGEIAFYIIGISDDKWLQMKISNLLFYDLLRRSLVAFSLHFYHFLECLAQISQHPRSQPGRLKKMHWLSAKCNVMFQKIQKAFWFEFPPPPPPKQVNYL